MKITQQSLNKVDKKHRCKKSTKITNKSTIQSILKIGEVNVKIDGVKGDLNGLKGDLDGLKGRVDRHDLTFRLLRRQYCMPLYPH